jgi:hypothetical protein
MHPVTIDRDKAKGLSSSQPAVEWWRGVLPKPFEHGPGAHADPVGNNAIMRVRLDLPNSLNLPKVS